MEVGSQGKGPRDTCPAHLLHLFCPVPPLPNCLHQGLFSNELPAPQFLSGGLLLGTFPKRVLNLGVHVATPPGFPPTLLAEVVHEDDLLQEGPGSCVEDAVHGSQEGGPGLVVETEDDASCGQAVLPPLLLTPAGAKTRAPSGEERPWPVFSILTLTPQAWAGAAPTTGLSSQLNSSPWVSLTFPREEGPGLPRGSAACSLPRASSLCVIPAVLRAAQRCGRHAPQMTVPSVKRE